jgi:hypothetical protein
MRALIFLKADYTLGLKNPMLLLSTVNLDHFTCIIIYSDQ